MHHVYIWPSLQPLESPPHFAGESVVAGQRANGAEKASADPASIAMAGLRDTAGDVSAAVSGRMLAQGSDPGEQVCKPDCQVLVRRITTVLPATLRCLSLPHQDDLGNFLPGRSTPPLWEPAVEHHTSQVLCGQSCVPSSSPALLVFVCSSSP